MNKVHKMEVFKGKNGNWFWRAIARNGREIASSGEGYEHKQHAIDMARALHPEVALFINDEEVE